MPAVHRAWRSEMARGDPSRFASAASSVGPPAGFLWVYDIVASRQRAEIGDHETPTSLRPCVLRPTSAQAEPTRGEL